MAGDYERAFEKWLSKSKGEKKPLVPNGKESEHAPDNNMPSPPSAPFLVDDDEEHESGEYFKNLGTGPPVLEPVSQHGRNVFDAVDREASNNSSSTPKQTDVSQGKLQTSEKLFKTYSAYGNTNKSPLKKKKLEGEKHVETKPNTENIFDKFCPASGLYIEDSPPPLIPSPKALAEGQQMSLECDAKKYTGKSPDFCAMEADSTSEIETCGKGQSLSDKNHNGEIPLECDSTCMLGGSPMIVSPNSTCGDTEEARDSNDIKQHRNVEIQCNEINFDEKPSTIRNSDKILSLVKSAENSESSFDQKMACEKADKSIGVNLTNSKSHIGFTVDPPALASTRPTNKQQNRRKQRHTVDSAEGLSKSRKVNPCNDIKYGPPPLLSPQESDNDLNSSQSKSKGKKSMKCKKALRSDRPCYKRSITAPVSSSLNHESIFVNALWQLSQLQTRMHTFLSQLWPQLHLEDMTPESPRFNSVVADLITMLERPDGKLDGDVEDKNSPAHPVESCEKLELSVPNPDFSSLGNPEQSTPQISTQEMKPYQQGSHDTIQVEDINNEAAKTSQHSLYSTPNPSSSSINQSLINPLVLDIPPPLDLAQGTHQTSDHLETSLCKQQQKPPIIIESCNTSTNLQNQPHCLSSNTSPTNSLPSLSISIAEPPLSNFSKLSLADGRELCARSVSIVLPREPDSTLADFISLSCRVLQLLLPEVPVSLTNELSCSPEALIAFIDNILALNNTTKKSHKRKY